jgi:proline iminopeptidase
LAEFVTADGVPISYCLRGSGPPLYFCHGGPFGSYDVLTADLQPLEEDFTLVLHDYRGSGRSGAASPETYDFRHLADDLEQLRRELGHPKIDLVAHSMGVWVALTFALSHPDSLDRLTLVGGSPVSPRRVPRAMARALGLPRAAKVSLQTLWFLALWSWRSSSAGARRSLVRISQTTQEGKREFRNLIQGRPILDNDDGSYLLRENMSVDLRSQLPAISCRTLVIYGTRDAMAVVGAEEFKRLPDVEFCRLVGVGHDVFIEDPEPALAAVRVFLKTPR